MDQGRLLSFSISKSVITPILYASTQHLSMVIDNYLIFPLAGGGLEQYMEARKLADHKFLENLTLPGRHITRKESGDV